MTESSVAFVENDWTTQCTGTVAVVAAAAEQVTRGAVNGVLQPFVQVKTLK